MENTPLKPATPPFKVWWLVWGYFIVAFFVVIGIFETGGVRLDVPPALSSLALASFGASVVVRFLFLPRTEPAKNFALFVTGLALADCGGLLALMLGSPWKTPLAAAAIVLIIVHIPAFIRRP
ncbi:MAG: hypothetical protein ACO3PN_04450 [Chthoniobacterales bacterium]